MPELSGLTIRRHERQSIELVIELLIADEHRKQVRFSATSSAPTASLVRGIAIDLSSGGMGLVVDQFVPKMCEGSVRVFAPTPVGRANDGSPIYDVIFEHGVKVRRAAMHSHDPTYALGVSFIDPEPDIESRVQELNLIALQASRKEGPDGDA